MAGNKAWQKAKQALGCLQIQTLDDSDDDNETIVSFDDRPGGSTRVLDEGASSSKATVRSPPRSSSRVLDEGGSSSKAPVRSPPRSRSRVLDEGASSSKAVVPVRSRSRALDEGASSPKAVVPRPSSPTSPPTPRRGGLFRFITSSSSNYAAASSSKPKICEICSSAMIPGQGANFNAECSHTFHFSCITSNLKYGNRICPVCRATWKEIPFQIRNPGPCENRRENWVPWNRNEPWAASLQQQHAPQPTRFIEPDIYDDDEAIQQQITGAEQAADSTLDITTYPEVSAITRFIEPEIYDDDEAIQQQITAAEQAADPTLEITTCPEVSAISKSSTFDDFTILVRLKARTPNPRVPVDVVVVLDVSGSMTGSNFSVLERDVKLLIRHLTPRDRLSIIAFSSTARRLFPLRLMNDATKTRAIQAVDSVSTYGGTNIGEGLRKGVKVMLDRKFKNPLGSIVVFTDGRETYTDTGTQGYESLIPSSIPVHTFLIGAYLETSPMHLISENSGGRLTHAPYLGNWNLESIGQCIGGRLRMFTQQLTVYVESNLQLRSVEAGKYRVRMADDETKGVIHAGFLYTEQDRDFLVTMNIPVCSDDEMLVLKVSCMYVDPNTQNRITLDEVKVKIDRPETIRSGPLPVAVEVDRQRNRVRAAVAMSEAESAAERGELARAVEILKSCHDTISASASVEVGDDVSVGLKSELGKMLERMMSRQVYQASTRAYILSGLSPYTWRWATTRREASTSTDVSQADQTAVVLGNVLPR
ncbi:hypothetical protein RND81_14G015600 [Saponaria officinalis]|uniref:Uncharacterized protein n=1 Tax=Saponaria officinalis TaxID=3572 RepID=A0AAW1GI02_SAPOF